MNVSVVAFPVTPTPLAPAIVRVSLFAPATKLVPFADTVLNAKLATEFALLKAACARTLAALAKE